MKIMVTRTIIKAIISTRMTITVPMPPLQGITAVKLALLPSPLQLMLETLSRLILAKTMMMIPTIILSRIKMNMTMTLMGVATAGYHRGQAGPSPLAPAADARDRVPPVRAGLSRLGRSEGECSCRTAFVCSTKSLGVHRKRLVTTDVIVVITMAMCARDGRSC
jgi:hypothetical protein